MMLIKGIKWGNRFISILKSSVITEGQFIEYLPYGDNFNHVYQYFDLTGNKQLLENTKADKKVINKVNIVYDRTDVNKAQVIDWKTLPIGFNRKKLKKILNDK